MKRILAHAGEITGDVSLWRVTPRLAWSALGMMYLIWGFNFIDTAFAGRLGDVSLAGLSTGAFVMWMVFGFANLISVGTGAVASRRIGEGNLPEAERIAFQSLLMAVMVGVVYGALTAWASPWIFTDVMRVTPDVHTEGWAYLRVVLLVSPFTFLFLVTGQIFFAAGDTLRPMLLMILALVVTLVFDDLFMFGRLGVPAMGTAGAGVAYAVSRVAYVGVALYILIKPKPPLFAVRPHGSWLPDWKLFGHMAYIGLPQAVEGTLFPLVYMLLTRYTTAHGTENVAALRIGHTVEGLVFFSALGMGMTIRPMVGQNLGAGNIARAKSAGWVGFALIALPALCFASLLILVPRAVAAVFADEPAVIQAAARYLHIVGWSQIFMVAELVFVGAFSGAGYTWIPMAIVIPFTVARWPLAAYLEPRIGVDGVWWAISISSIVKGVLLTIWFSLGTWTKKRV